MNPLKTVTLLSVTKAATSITITSSPHLFALKAAFSGLYSPLMWALSHLSLLLLIILFIFKEMKACTSSW